MADDKGYDVPVKVVDRRRWREDGGSNPEGAPEASLKPTYVEELEQKLAQRQKEAEEYLAKYRQAAREFEDARARMRKELAKDAERSRREVIVSLLEVVDNLDRAIEAAEQAKGAENGRERERLASGAEPGTPGTENVSGASGPTGAGREDSLLQGVELVRQQFLAKLGGLGVTRIATDGAPFDPVLHEAVSAVPVSNPAQDGRIVGVVRHGYRIGEDVLRPALVAVAKQTEAPG